MKTKYKYYFFFIFILLLFSISLLFLYFNYLKTFRVAHAGGEYNGLKYVNSIAAMNLNSKYTKYIELDLQLTKDNRLVCIHDPLINNKSLISIGSVVTINANLTTPLDSIYANDTVSLNFDN